MYALDILKRSENFKLTILIFQRYKRDLLIQVVSLFFCLYPSSFTVSLLFRKKQIISIVWNRGNDCLIKAVYINLIVIQL